MAACVPNSLHFQYFRGLFTELGYDSDGNPMAGAIIDNFGLEAIQSIPTLVVQFKAKGVLCIFLGGELGDGAEAFLPSFELFLVATAKMQALDDELTAIVVVVNFPIGDVFDATCLHVIFDGVIDVEASDFDVACIWRVNDKSNVRLADGDEGASAFVLFQETVLHQVVVHTDFGHGELAKIVVLVIDAVLEGETEKNEP